MADSNGRTFCEEAAGFLEVILVIRRNGKTETLEACMNFNKTISQIKQTLSVPLNIPADNMEFWKDNTKLQDNVLLMDCGVSDQDILEVRVTGL